MDWRLTHQLSSKNLSVGEKLAMTEEFKKEVALENEKKKDEAQKTFQGNQHVDCTPIGVDSKIDGRKDTWTDSQTAKKAGFGVGMFYPLMDNMISLIGREVVRINRRCQIRHMRF